MYVIIFAQVPNHHDDDFTNLLIYADKPGVIPADGIINSVKIVDEDMPCQPGLYEVAIEEIPQDMDSEFEAIVIDNPDGEGKQIHYVHFGEEKE